MRVETMGRCRDIKYTFAQFVIHHENARSNHSVNDSTTKYIDDLHMTNLEENKFASPINCHIAHVVEDPTSNVLKSSPNPTLSQLTTLNCHMELEDPSSAIKNEEASSTFAFMH